MVRASRGSGTSVRHRSTASGQRGGNGQPGGNPVDGGAPRWSRTGPWAGPGGGKLDSSAWLYGCSGAVNTSRAGACSTMRPPYITATSSAISATTPMSWVIHSSVVLCSSCSSRTSAMISACTVTSSAVVGSSATSSAGRSAMAIAIITRWRMPPDSSCGYRRAVSSGRRIPTRASSCTAWACAAASSSRYRSRNTSAICRPARCTGLSAADASCGM